MRKSYDRSNSLGNSFVFDVFLCESGYDESRFLRFRTYRFA